MKKNITINLCGRLFQIDEDAYELLQQYIESLRQSFGHEEGGEEIVNDIEARIAELFSELNQQGIEAITIEHVKDIITPTTAAISTTRSARLPRALGIMYARGQPANDSIATPTTRWWLVCSQALRPIQPPTSLGGASATCCWCLAPTSYLAPYCM